MSTKKIKKSKLKYFILLLAFAIILPLIYIGIAFIGRVSPDSVIPDSFTAYTHIRNPIHTADKLLAHEPFYSLLLTPPFSSYLPVVSKIKENAILEKKWVRSAGKGSMEGALFSDGKFLAAWDIGVTSYFIRFFPNIAGKLSIPNIQRMKKSRFEYRVSDNNVVFIQPYKNLLIISNDLKLFESVLDGTSRTANLKGSGEKIFLSHDFDAGFLCSSESVVSWFFGSSPMAESFLKQLDFADFAELGLSIFQDKIEVSMMAHVASDNESVDKLLARNSRSSALVQRLPATAESSTVFSIGTVEELLKAAMDVYAQKMPVNLMQVEMTSRFFLGIGISDLLFSWTGTEIAALGIERNDHPVFVLEITDEQKRKEVFKKLGDSVPVVKGSAAASQIKLPGFLSMVFNMLNIKISAPYYVVQNDFLFLSESFEALVSAIEPIRKDDLLLNTELWKSLSRPGAFESSLTLFYPVDRIIPFFVNSNDVFEDVLKSYKQGLVKVNIDNGLLTVNLAVCE